MPGAPSLAHIVHSIASAGCGSAKMTEKIRETRTKSPGTADNTAN